MQIRIGFLLSIALLAAPGAAAEALQVVATVPDLGSLTRSVGGDEVEVFVLARGPQDAHFVEPRPSFVRKLHDADLYVQQGMELEIGWAPVLLQQARNAAIQPGGRGHVDASSAITPLEVPLVKLRWRDREGGFTQLTAYAHPDAQAKTLVGIQEGEPVNLNSQTGVLVRGAWDETSRTWNEESGVVTLIWATDGVQYRLLSYSEVVSVEELIKIAESVPGD